MNAPAVDVRGLTFRYRGEADAVLHDVTLQVPAGARCLLLGRNGAGKTTLLRVLSGMHMVDPETVRVLGRAAFHDTSLSRQVAFLGGPFSFTADISVAAVLERTPQHDAARTRLLLDVLGVDPAWRMYRVSDGQRRRVQVLLGLLQPPEVILLDEVTTDLDVVARADLVEFLRRESEQRGATLLYATHILDGLYEWATHLAWMENGRLRRMAPTADFPELAELRARNVPSPLLRLAERWLRHGYGN